MSVQNVSKDRRRLYCLLLCVALMATVSCSEDTCNNGLNMSAPHIDGGIYTDAGMPAVRISWSQGTERGARLPETYFAQVSLVENGEDFDLIGSVRFMAPQTIVVRFTSAFWERVKSKPTVTFELRFPDRRDSISCYHRGMSDRYFLKVEMTFDDKGRLASSSLGEFVYLGPI